ncbi:MAG: response regulator transcription factor, partial [Clostridia bacterium]|nr:response regulator transcription factor [Clostridia bacterium]
MFKILVAEDDFGYRTYLETILKREGYTPIMAKNGEEALDLLGEHEFCLAILDLMMPKLDGYQLLEKLRQWKKELPVLIVSAKHLPADKRKAFLLGTDDYVIKPVDEEELLLRIKALLRRAKIESEHKIQIGKAVLDYKAFSLTYGETPIFLTKKEFLLLYKLLSSPGIAFSRYQLLDDVWGYDNE